MSILDDENNEDLNGEGTDVENTEVTDTENADAEVTDTEDTSTNAVLDEEATLEEVEVAKPTLPEMHASARKIRENIKEQEEESKK